MSKVWLKVIFGVFCEVIWVIGMKYSIIWWEILGIVIVIFISFYVLIKVGEELLVGIVYVVFVGLGSVGIIVIDYFLFYILLGIGKVFFLLLLLIGIIGLKMVIGNKEEEIR